MLDLLASLADKSLVAVELDSGRYRLLETIRQYAREKLEASGEENAVRERHLDFYLAFAEAAEPHQNGPHQSAWRGRLDLEQENFLSALEFCGRSADWGAKGLRLVNAMRMYWFRRGLLPTGKRLVTEALRHPGAQTRDKQRSVALASAGLFCSFAGEYDQATGYLEESLETARELAEREQIIEHARVAGLRRTRARVPRGCARPRRGGTCARARDW